MKQSRPRDPTLLRVVLLTTFVGLCMLAILPSTPPKGAARAAKARADVEAIANAVDIYRARWARMPSSLRDLLIRDANGQSCLRELPEEPWLRDYELRGEAVVSAGPNGVFGDDDDVSARSHTNR